MASSKPFADYKIQQIKGLNMAYVDEGSGDAIIFQHGQPTSSYVWRNVMPHMVGLGRLVAADLVGMGASDKIPGSGPDHYSLAEHGEYLFALWDSLDLGDNIVLVLDDWGVPLGVHWARLNPHRVKAIVHMEGVAVPMSLNDLPEPAHPFFKALRSPMGESMVLEQNIFMEQILPGATIRDLSADELAAYRKPFLEAGEARRPTLEFPRNLPLDGQPAVAVATIAANATWMAGSADMPKLFIHGKPGTLMRGRVLEEVQRWPNQETVTVSGIKILQEDSAEAIGRALADFVTRLQVSA